VKAALLASTAACGKPLALWFQDEARVGQNGTHAHVWAPVGSRPPMVRDNRHDSVPLFGAICPARGVGAAIIMPAVNTEAMNEPPAEIRAQLAPDAPAVAILDGAGWHQRGGGRVVPDNISPLSLPPYAPDLNPPDLNPPDLNPMENVGDYLRADRLCALVWDRYDAIVQACRSAWAFPVDDPAHMRSIGTRASASVRG